MSAFGDFVQKNVMPPLVAGLLPLVEKKWDEEVPKLEALLERVLKQKLDELVPDSIDKNIPQILDKVGEIIPKLAGQLTDLIPNLIAKAFNAIPGVNILGGFHL